MSDINESRKMFFRVKEIINDFDDFRYRMGPLSNLSVRQAKIAQKVIDDLIGDIMVEILYITNGGSNE